MTGSSLSIPSSPHRAIALIWNTLHLTDHPGLLYHRTVPIAHPGLLYHTAVPFAQPGLLLLLAPWNHSNVSRVCHYLALQWLVPKLHNMYPSSHRTTRPAVPHSCTCCPTWTVPVPFLKAFTPGGTMESYECFSCVSLSAFPMHCPKIG